MATFLVDYENVHVEGFNGLSNCKESDEIKIFYTKSADTLTFGLHRRLSETKAKIEYHKVENGTKNALDFQLASYLGYLIGKNSEVQYYIVSKDKGFMALEQFWKKNPVKHTTVTLVSDLTLKIEIEVQNQMKSSIQSVLKDGAYKDNSNEIISLIDKYKTKQGIYSALVKTYEEKKGAEIYKKIKPLLTEKKGQ